MSANSSKSIQTAAFPATKSVIVAANKMTSVVATASATINSEIELMQPTDTISTTKTIVTQAATTATTTAVTENVEINKIVNTLNGNNAVFKAQLEALSTQEQQQQQQQPNKQKMLQKPASKLHSSSINLLMNSNDGILLNENQTNENTNSLLKSKDADLTAINNTDDVNNCRIWSEALAHAQTIHITDSVVLSVAKTANNANNTSKQNTNLMPTITVKEKLKTQNINFKTMLPVKVAGVNNDNNKTNNNYLQIQQQQQQESILTEDCERTKQMSLLKSKQQIMPIQETIIQQQQQQTQAQKKTNNKINNKNNNNNNKNVEQTFAMRAKRAQSVNYPPLQDVKPLNAKSKEAEDAKKINQIKNIVERRNSTPTICNKIDKIDLKLLLKKNIALLHTMQAKKNCILLNNNLPAKLSELSTAVLQKNNIKTTTTNVKEITTTTTTNKQPIILQETKNAEIIKTPKLTNIVAEINLDSDDDDNDNDDYSSDNIDALKTDEQFDDLTINKNVKNLNNKNNLQKNLKTQQQQQVKQKDKQKLNENSRTAAATDAPIVADVNTFSSAVDILSTFNMLTWRERVGSARGTKLRFQLNEFNLLQVYERINPRAAVPSVFERPIYERDDTQNNKLRNGQPLVDPLLYLCRRCRCHGPANEFLAPEFCSMECLKRNVPRKRSHMDASAVVHNKDTQNMQKRARTMVPSGNNATQTNANATNVTNNQTAQKCTSFQWWNYIKTGSTAASIALFLNPFPTGPNRFKVGMKLEAIDPENCSLFCVCTVVVVAGFRLKLAFDGYDYMYEFWVNADSMDIFPPGWCQKTGRILQPPAGIWHAEFNWMSYLNKTHGTPAPRTLFTHLNAGSVPSKNPFKVGMHLEAEDLNDTGKLCVATVADVLNDRVRIHFDGWDDCYDYWVDISSPYIHPVGWHEGRQKLVPPPGYAAGSFVWSEYIRRMGGIATPAEHFQARGPIEFQPNTKLEVVDPRLPSLIRPATIVARKGHRIKLHLDLWPASYCFWLEDDSPDVHPIGWCDATGHELEPPPGYKSRTYRNNEPSHFPGCRNIGNARNYQRHTHNTLDECPYSPQNWRYKPQRPRRVEGAEIVGGSTKKSPLSATNSSSQLSYTQEQTKSSKTKKLLEQPDTKPKIADLEKASKLEINSKTNLLSIAKVEKCAKYIVDDGIEIAKQFLCDYGPRLQQSFDLWQRHMRNNSNSAVFCNKIVNNPLNWTAVDVAAFVERVLNSPNIANIFLQEDIDGGAFLLLQQSDISHSLLLPLGPTIKLHSNILQLRAIYICKFQNKSQALF